MKNSHIAFWAAALGGLDFLYNIHQIHDVDVDADAWAAKVDADANPDVGTYAKALFDGFTLGAFSRGDVFAEAHKNEQVNNELEAERLVLFKSYDDAVWHRNLGFVFGVDGIVAGRILKNKGGGADQAAAMKTLYTILLSVALPFAGVSADTIVQGLGTPFSHDWIWSIYTNAQSQLADKSNAVEDTKDRIAELENDITQLSSDIENPVSLNKGEFETTKEFQARQAEANAESRSKRQATINDDKQLITKLKDELVAAGDSAKTLPTDSELKLPPTIRFYLQVKMGPYDADTEIVSYFDPMSKVQQYPDYVKVASDGGVESIFDFAGCLGPINSIQVPIDKAKKLREADNQGNLWVGFTAKPKPISFSEGYTLTNVTEVKMVENILPSAKVLGARIFTSALGGDPGAVPDDPIPQFHKETTYLGDVNHEARIIHTGWEGMPILDTFYIYDNSTGRLTPIE